MALSSHAQEDIYAIVNKEILLEDHWAGQSLTLVYENNKYVLLRKIFGSGRPVIYTKKYDIEFNSDYVIETSGDPETFKIMARDGIKVFLNGLKLHVFLPPSE
jgi:hypothetical protein